MKRVSLSTPVILWIVGNVKITKKGVCLSRHFLFPFAAVFSFS